MPTVRYSYRNKADNNDKYTIRAGCGGAEIWYQKIEKAAHAVILAARKLRQYFKSQSIIVKTDPS